MLHVTATILYLVGVGVGGAHLHCVGKVYYDLIIRGRAQLLKHPVADKHGVVHLCAGKALGRILIPYIYIRIGGNFLRELADKLRAVHGNIYDPLHISVEYNTALEGGGGVVEVDYYILCAVYGLKGLPDKVFPRLDKHLDSYVVRDKALVDKGA